MRRLLCLRMPTSNVPPLLQQVLSTAMRVKFVLELSRSFVQDSKFEEFYSAFAKHVELLKMGDGMDPNTTIGPMANAREV